MISAKEKHELMRRELWLAVATSVARAEDCKKSEVPGKYADRALADFDKNFPQPIYNSAHPERNSNDRYES